MKVGGCWGTDAIIELESLRYTFTAIAQSYTCAYMLRGEDVRQLIKSAPTAARQHVRREQLRWTFRRAVIRAAEEDLQSRGHKLFRGIPFLLARHPNEVSLAHARSPHRATSSPTLPRLALAATGTPNFDADGKIPVPEEDVPASEGPGVVADIKYQLQSLCEEQKRQALAMEALRNDMQAILGALNASMSTNEPKAKHAINNSGTNASKVPYDA